MNYAAIELRQRIVGIKRARTQRRAAKQLAVVQERRRVEEEREEEKRLWREGYWIDKEAGLYSAPYAMKGEVSVLAVGCCHCRSPEYYGQARAQVGRTECAACGTPLWIITREQLEHHRSLHLEDN
jgi:hypothetical protein